MVDITGSLDQKGDINAAAIAVYVLLLAALLVVFLKGGIRMGYVYVALFALIKVIGAAMTIDVQLTQNTSLVTAAAIISTVVLSPLMLGTSSLINPGSDNLHTKSARFASKLVHLIHIVIIVALALGVYGGLKAFGTSSDSSDITNGRTFLRVSAALWCICWGLIYLSVAMFWSERRYLGNFYRKLYPVIAFLVMPIFIARIAFTVGTAATIDEPQDTQIFNPLTGGSWVVYLLLEFLPEVAIGTLLTFVGLVSGKDYEGTKQEAMPNNEY